MNRSFMIWFLTLVLCTGWVFYERNAVANTQYSLPLTLTSPSPATNVWGRSIDASDEALRCLALDIYFESRSDPIAAQYAVADVVMYRLLHYNFPSTVCGVIKDGIYPAWNKTVPYKYRCSFTWWCDRKSDIPKDEEAYVLAMKIATDVLTNVDYVPVLSYALYYHAEYVSPGWDKKYLVRKLGTHFFYTRT